MTWYSKDYSFSLETAMDERKTKLAMLYLASKQGWQINMYPLLKMIFDADRYHLLKWGDTITGDNYSREKYGPVPLGAWKLAKTILRPPYTIDPRDFLKEEARKTITADQVKDELSVWEMEALDQAYNLHKGRPFDGVKKIAHRKTYLNRNISLEDLAEGDEALIAHIKDRREYKEALGR
jgi:hypothetical protein